MPHLIIGSFKLEMSILIGTSSLSSLTGGLNLGPFMCYVYKVSLQTCQDKLLKYRDVELTSKYV